MPSPHALVLIPARMRSTRLPGKPLADIAGQPMILHVARRAAAAGIGPVVIATDDASIAGVVEAAGLRAVLTGAGHRSGSDRIAEAVARIDPERRFGVVVNLQGDEPELAPGALRAAAALLDAPDVQIGTLATALRDGEGVDPNAVKLHGIPLEPGRVAIRTFSRASVAPDSPGCWRHVGLYAFRRAALERFVALPPSANECREGLEQLRALDAGMRIEAALVADAPRGVDTPADLAAVRERFARGPVR